MNELSERIAQAMHAVRDARVALDRISEEKSQSDPEVLEAVRNVAEAKEALRTVCER
jgi:hypothetical protein